MAERGIHGIIPVSYSLKTDLSSAGLKSVCETATILFMNNKMFHRSVSDRRNLVWYIFFIFIGDALMFFFLFVPKLILLNNMFPFLLADTDMCDHMSVCHFLL